MLAQVELGYTSPSALNNARTLQQQQNAEEDPSAAGSTGDTLVKVFENFAAHGTADDKTCLMYVLQQTTGSNKRQWANGVLDEGRPTGLTFDHFCKTSLASRSTCMPFSKELCQINGRDRHN